MIEDFQETVLVSLVIYTTNRCASPMIQGTSWVIELRFNGDPYLSQVCTFFPSSFVMEVAPFLGKDLVAAGSEK